MKTTWLISATLFACSSEAPIMDTRLTGAGMNVDVDPAAEQITSDRCKRQLSCGNVGKGHVWNDRRQCEVEAAPRVRSVIGVSCVSIDATRLTACRDEIRDQRCAETGTMPASCEGVRLCR